MDVPTRTGRRNQGRSDWAMYSLPSSGPGTSSGPQTPGLLLCSGKSGRRPRLCCISGSLCGRLGGSQEQTGELKARERKGTRALGRLDHDAEIIKPRHAHPLPVHLPALPPGVPFPPPRGLLVTTLMSPIQRSLPQPSDTLRLLTGLIFLPSTYYYLTY